ncbi:hypothetical protein ACFWCA_32735 [Streptomyces phaeochromogenes]|uniref:hypothetical protein n=1 Tax=Streptomyces phaeochromogenes TaxID=1923 RepID=UPI0036D164DE
MIEQQTDREHYLAKAVDAARSAANLAGHAENAAHHPDKRGRVAEFAAAGSLWADVARRYTAIALATPEPADQDKPADTDEEN